jgi:hypothetical protein
MDTVKVNQGASGVKQWLTQVQILRTRWSHAYNRPMIWMQTLGSHEGFDYFNYCNSIDTNLQQRNMGCHSSMSSCFEKGEILYNNYFSSYNDVFSAVPENSDAMRIHTIPNPVTQTLTILPPPIDTYSYTIIHVSGVQVQIGFGDSHGCIDVSELRPGAYTIVISDLSSKRFARATFIKI